jgi:hypothetical protein
MKSTVQVLPERWLFYTFQEDPMNVLPRSIRACLCSALAVVATQASDVKAEQTYHGSVCQPSRHDPSLTLEYSFNGIMNVGPGPSQPVTCPTPIDHSIGATATWLIRVEDQNGSAGFSCTGFVLNADGNVIAQTPSCGTTAAFTGSTTFTCSATVAYSTTFSHLIQCSIPSGSTFIKRITLN